MISEGFQLCPLAMVPMKDGAGKNGTENASRHRTLRAEKGGLGEQRFDPAHDLVGRETEFLLEIGQRRRGAEAFLG